MSAFFLFYKKGTSLVELIAVIVIMGIIAGIAIPTTIAVINRQKKNAATKTAENVYKAAQTLLLEAQSGGAAVAGTAAGDSEHGGCTFYTTAAMMVSSGDLDSNPVDNDGAYEIRIDGNNKFTIAQTTLTINSITVNVNTNEDTGVITFSA